MTLSEIGKIPTLAHTARMGHRPRERNHREAANEEGFFDYVPTCPRTTDSESRSVGTPLRMTQFS